VYTKECFVSGDFVESGTEGVSGLVTINIDLSDPCPWKLNFEIERRTLYHENNRASRTESRVVASSTIPLRFFLRVVEFARSASKLE